MKRLGILPGSLDAVLVSHLHGDHFAGVPFLFLEDRYLEPRRKPLNIAGPLGVEERVRDLGRVLYSSGAAAPDDDHVGFVEMRAGASVRVGPAEVHPFAARHAAGEPCLGLRLELEGRTVVYSGDTEWCEELVERSRGADLLILECSFRDEDAGGHTRMDDILRNQERLECARLLLVHLGPAVLEARDLHDLPWAEDGQIVEL
jgi:ribonuclease BN (tRNA processing enzyme)